MQEATFLILTALAAGSQHGYGIITDVEQISNRRVSWAQGPCIPPWSVFARTDSSRSTARRSWTAGFVATTD